MRLCLPGNTSEVTPAHADDCSWQYREQAASQLHHAEAIKTQITTTVEDEEEVVSSTLRVHRSRYAVRRTIKRVRATFSAGVSQAATVLAGQRAPQSHQQVLSTVAMVQTEHMPQLPSHQIASPPFLVQVLLPSAPPVTTAGDASK
ncbi:hypothetical protein TGP89_245760 [Toxoplasma gondii p89]|uniref:Uncharacterized protein n=1 Tax=Toxoplasma gondii p89 TaxID=943119 RepID=A0A086KTR3_TOXGO|nr:hypothetical protein TGP89_245760 [Toxoplasma gondii p89]